MRLSDLARYGIWAGVAATAAGNRRQYGMTTTWLPHLAANTISLLLPDALRAAQPLVPQTRAERQNVGQLLYNMLAATVRDNPRYVVYVSPLAAGYLLSAPWLNIYKGALGELRFAGFGLDALPHAGTAFSMSALFHEMLDALADFAPHNQLGDIARWLNDHRNFASAVALALATLLWETGEYRIYKQELAQGGTDEAINMQWSLEDTLTDVAANAIGWLIATLYDRGIAPQFSGSYPAAT